MTDEQKLMRLALRPNLDGSKLVAYLAPLNTMVGAVRLASFAAVLADRPARLEQFVQLMSDCVADLIEEDTGERPTEFQSSIPGDWRGGNGNDSAT